MRQEKSNSSSGCIKKLFLLTLLLAMAYFAVHIYYIWKPVGKSDPFTTVLVESTVFPAIKPYSFLHIDGRKEILEGAELEEKNVKGRLDFSIERQQPVTFTEEELNIWLQERLKVRQEGLLKDKVNIRGIWVDLQPGVMEVIIEREYLPEKFHATSMFLKFERTEKGLSIQPFSCQIGEVKAPGGFARLILPAFKKLAAELSEEIQPYHDRKIYNIEVEDGKITLDPRPIVKEKK